jgi:hypothetical protein
VIETCQSILEIEKDLLNAESSCEKAWDSDTCHFRLSAFLSSGKIRTGKAFVLSACDCFRKLSCAPFGQRQTIQLPRGVVIPQQPMFLDIYTFRVAGEQIQRKKRLSRYNGINDLKYKIRFLSWSGNRYQIELEGRHENFKFNRILVEAAVDKTKIVRIRRSVSHTLYVALTPIEQYDPSLKGFVPPTLISKQQPVYPSELRKKRWSGTIRIHAFVTREGRIGREEFVFLECPHYLFARNSLDAVLNQWIYKPATRDGVPIDSDTTIDVGFTMLRPVVQTDLQR